MHSCSSTSGLYLAAANETRIFSFDGEGSERFTGRRFRIEIGTSQKEEPIGNTYPVERCSFIRDGNVGCVTSVGDPHFLLKAERERERVRYNQGELDIPH